VATAPDGTLWVGTDMGAAQRKDGTWSLRHSRRWLLNDDVRAVAFDKDGATWLATAGGVSAIKRKNMTFVEKEAYFQQASEARHVRAPYLVEACALTRPGDLTSWKPRDDDNDGEYTSMFIMGEAYHYAVTKDPAAKARADQAFDAMRFLQTVTGTPGFFARTVIPSDCEPMNDRNEDASDQEWIDRQAEAPRYKKVNVRWHPSADGRWLWKGDTSSDETTGHFCGYLFYYDLVADDSQKPVVREHVAKVMDYIIDGGYVFKDVDGQHTRWGVWAPERLNHDPDWAAERGINSAEILSYLLTTWHITGNDKYRAEYLRLAREEGYAENARHAKTFAKSWRTHIDDELLALVYPALLMYETDPELLKIYRESFEAWYQGIAHDENPFFNFLYSGLTDQCVGLDASGAFLRDAPLDLVNWLVDNSKREDLTLVRAPEVEPLQTSRLLPASERGVVRWDKNPWEAVQGDGGHTEWAPTFWLVAYWMGRYYGFVN